MKRALLSAMLASSLILIFVIVSAADFYVIPVRVNEQHYAPVEKTGQTPTVPLDPAPAGSDGDLNKGVSWPSPRFTSNVDKNGDGDCYDVQETCDGTVTDNLTGLIWLKNASCTRFFQNDDTGINNRSWSDALAAANWLLSGYCGLSDGSIPGDWRLPNVKELHSLIHYGFFNPSLPDSAGTGQWEEGNPFTGVVSNFYWSSSIFAGGLTFAWDVDMFNGQVTHAPNELLYYVWPVRGGN